MRPKELIERIAKLLENHGISHMVARCGTEIAFAVERTGRGAFVRVSDSIYEEPEPETAHQEPSVNPEIPAGIAFIRGPSCSTYQEEIEAEFTDHKPLPRVVCTWCGRVMIDGESPNVGILCHACVDKMLQNRSQNIMPDNITCRACQDLLGRIGCIPEGQLSICSACFSAWKRTADSWTDVSADLEKRCESL